MGESLLAVNHDDMPLNVFLNSIISFARFTTISTGNGKSYAGQIRRRCP